jgi:hypothetical protein
VDQNTIAEQIRALLEPFQPFRLILCDGRVVNVEDRDSTKLTPSGQTLYLTNGGRRFLVDISQVIRVVVQRNCKVEVYQHHAHIETRLSPISLK